MRYGLSPKDISAVYDKIDKQKGFLNTHYIELNGEKVPLSSFFKNTFINADRYIAELQHRVWSLVEFANNRGLVNVFITLSLPSEYHPKKKLSNEKLIDNPNFAHKNIQLFDIITKERPEKLYKHDIRVHHSTRLNYWTKKVTTLNLVKRKYLKELDYDDHPRYDKYRIRTYKDLLHVFQERAFEMLRKDIEIYDIHTRERTLEYQNLVLKQKPIADMPRWTGRFIEISLLEKDYTPVTGSKYLTKMWETIRKDRTWQELHKDDRLYFRVTEPHDDGTPHIHISAWIPKESVKKFVQAVHRLYPAPAADIATSFIPDGYEYYEKAYKDYGKWYGAYKPSEDSNSYIKVRINDTIAYLMKYIYKTLDDLRGDNGISEITMWYIHHGICRFYTSRTLISLNVYRPLNGKFSLLELTQHYRDDTISVWLDPDTMQPRIIQYEDMIMWNKQDYELKQFESKTKKDKPIRLRTIDVEIDGEEFYIYRTGGTKLYPKIFHDEDFSHDEDFLPVAKMKMLQLWNYYHSLDPECPTLNLKHFGLVHNTMIERGLIDGEVVPIDHYNTDIFDLQEVAV